MPQVTVAPGLPADWLNGWLAAVGVTVLLPDARLAWTGDPTPLARFEVPPGASLAQRIASALPSLRDLDALVIASSGRDVGMAAFRDLSQAARVRRDASLASSVTDLVQAEDGKAAHGRFDPPTPRGETLFTRLRKCRLALVEGITERVEGTLEGRGSRIAANGLGFDYRRLRAAVHSGDLHVDPLVECLCFAGLELFPVRGSGMASAQTRGWLRSGTRAERFVWPAWTPTLDRWGIDALLDATHSAPADGERLGLLGVTAVFESASYQRRGSADVATGYASRRLR